MRIDRQILDMVNLGILILDENCVVREWNRWLAVYSGIGRDAILNRSVFDFFPGMDSPNFRRGCRAVFAFGNVVFFSQMLHKYLIPLKLTGSHASTFDYMQQSCTMAPLRDEEGDVDLLLISVQDVTETVILERKLKEMSFLDGLTGIYNRRSFNHRLEEEFARHRRAGRPMCLIIFDIDHFKNFNDNYGHQFGDEALKQTAARCRQMLRRGDVLARYGGEEFAIILPETELEQAAGKAEKLRSILADKKIAALGLSANLTVSMGVADISDMNNTPERLLMSADQALYRAKQSGRNNIKVGG